MESLPKLTLFTPMTQFTPLKPPPIKSSKKNFFFISSRWTFVNFAFFFLHLLAIALAKIVKWIENFSPLLSEKENSVFLFQFFFFYMKKSLFYIFHTFSFFNCAKSNWSHFLFDFISLYIYFQLWFFVAKKNSLLSFMVWSEGCRLHQVECLSNSLIWLSSLSLRDMGLSRTVKTSERFLKLKIVWKWRFLFSFFLLYLPSMENLVRRRKKKHVKLSLLLL